VRSLFLAPRDDGYNEQEARKAKMSEKRYIRSSENVGVTKKRENTPGRPPATHPYTIDSISRDE
jgi:hypothetical protein